MLSIPWWMVMLALVFCLVVAAEAGEFSVAERETWNNDTRAVIPRMSTPPTIDGRIGSDEWRESAVFNVQISQRSRGFYPRQVTWRVAWDDEHLYVASHSPLYPNERPRRRARSSAGSAVMFDESLEMWFDPKGRSRDSGVDSYFQTMTNALGISYFCRLYPKEGARTEEWNPGWVAAQHLDGNDMDFEFAIPRQGLALAEPNRAGDLWGVLLARNFRTGDHNQSPMGYKFRVGFDLNNSYPRLELAADRPYVQFRYPRPLYDGRVCAEATIRNPTAVEQQVQAALEVRDTEGETVRFRRESALAVPAGGEVALAVDGVATPAIDVAADAVYRYGLTVTDVRDGKELYHTHFRYNPSRDRKWLDHRFPPQPPLQAQATLNPVRFCLDAVVDTIDYPGRDKVTGARTIVYDPEGERLVDMTYNRCFRHLFRDILQLPALKPGTYRWESFARLQDGSEEKAGEGELVKKDEAKEFPWWGTTVGKAEKVLWPFGPVSADDEGRVLKAWGKEVHLDGLALPSRIRSTGNMDKWPAGRAGEADVLAGPVVFSGVVDGKPVTWQPPKRPHVVQVQDHAVDLRGEAAAGGVRVTTETRLEQDGAYFVELKLQPDAQGEAVTVSQADLRVPLRPEVADFISAHGAPGYSSFFMDAVPDAEGPAVRPGSAPVVWDSTRCGASQVTQGAFVPQIWIGNEHRGLAWYADSDRGWTPVDGRPPQEITRSADAVTLVLHLVQTPVELTAPRTVRFVMQPTPIRPLQPGWRMLNISFSQSFMDQKQFGRPGWTANSRLESADAFPKSLAFAKKFPGPTGSRPTLNPYFAPHTESSRFMSAHWGDARYFGPEWIAFRWATYAPTLCDHLLWHVNEWVTRGGLQGLYHDQFAPTKIDSVSSGLAYFLPDGRVQPGFALTTRRRYNMRQHALWLENGIAPPRTLTHTTHGGPLGALGWVESCVDGEDKRLNHLATVDFADTWPSSRMRAGSLSYNWGVTFGWMRLIDPAGMTAEQKTRHDRIYFSHVLMHDCGNPYDIGRRMLLGWGMDDDRVLFWPFWSNGDVVRTGAPEVKASAWSLSTPGNQRLLLLVTNYGKEGTAEVTVAVDLEAMGVTLGAGAQVVNLETPDAARANSLPLSPGGEPLVGGDPAQGTVALRIPPRDFALVSFESAPPKE